MSINRRKLAVGAAVVAGLLLTIIVGLWLGVPAALRWGLESAAAREIGRQIQVGDIRFNPFTLRLALSDLTVAGAPGEGRPLLTLDELHAQLSTRSVWRLAPIVRSMRLQALRANIARLAPNRFNFSDIIDRLAARPSEGEPARFALNNIELVDGAVAIDDQVVGKKHGISEIRIGIPFLSTLPDDEEIKVKPALSARVNEALFQVDGETLPFADTLETSVAIRFTGLQLPTYLGYVPLPLQFSLASGTLDTDLRLAYRRAVTATNERPAQPARLLLTGRAAVGDLALIPNDMKEPLVQWRLIDVMLEEVEPLQNSYRIASVSLTRPVLRATRRGDGAIAGLKSLELTQPGSGAGPRADATPLQLSIARFRLDDGVVQVHDEVVDFRRTVQSIAVELDGFSTTGETPARLTASAGTDDHAQLKVDGEVRAVPLNVGVDASLQALPLAGLMPYLRQFTTADVTGEASLGGRITAAERDGQIAVAVADGVLTARDLSVKGPRGRRALLAAPKVEVRGIGIDQQQRIIEVERATVTGARARAGRDADGRRFVYWQALIAEAPPKAAAGRSADWSVRLQQLDVVNARLQAFDQAVSPAVVLNADGLNAVVRNLDSDLAKRIDVQLRTRLGGGTAAGRGWLRVQPLATELAVDVANVDVSPLRPYVARFANAELASAAVSAKGTLAIDIAKETPRVRYQGTARVTDFAALNPSGEGELARWQALALDAVRVDTGTQPLSVDIGALKLNDFYARAILSAQGQLNLVEVFASPAGSEGQQGKSPPSGGESATTATRSRTAAGESPVRLRIGGIELLRGNVNFTDNFVKPNYTANLTDLIGTIGTLSSEQSQLADVSVRGRIDRDAPVEITGKVNPLAMPLALDLRGVTEGVELPRLTPYSVKYAGYPITRGRLSMDVHYLVEHNKLRAENHLFLDQLTFGKRVESPTATKLPVELAVSLLKNSRGEIDINLPISGSLDDPQFSLGGIIVQAIVNLLTKIVTAPFTALSAAFGGDADLGHAGFSPGSAQIPEAEVKKLETLAKALNDRPALRLDVTGRAVAGVDTEPLRLVKFDAKLRAAKVREIVRGGANVDPATVKIAPEERERLIGRVYDDEKIPDKPRNFLGIAKTIPAADMEKLIMATITVTEEDLRQLANDRAAAVRDRLSEQGKVPRERLFLVAPLLDASGDDKLPPTRVDFSLK